MRVDCITKFFLVLTAGIICFVGRPRKAGPPPERKLEGSIDVIGGEGSRGNYRNSKTNLCSAIQAIHHPRTGFHVHFHQQCYKTIGSCF